jgi:hypothetical protein
MNIKEIKETVSIVDLLSKLGFEPSKKSGKETFFLSPIRESDTNASFSVNDSKGYWYDHGLGQGGNVVDLGLLLFKTNSISKVIEQLSNLYNGDQSFSFVKREQTAKDIQPRHEIVSIKDLGNNISISNYINSRGVLKAAVASNLLKEVYYDFVNDEGLKKRYFGVGWQNVSGGYDVRSKYGKICIAKKDLLYKEGLSSKVVMFEGMFNYLSALERMEGINKDHLIVLNSTSMVNKAVDLINANRKIKEVDLYLDNGIGGKKFTKEIQLNIPHAIDRSYLYKNFDDYNDMIKSEMINKIKKPWEGENAQKKNIFSR